MAHGGAVSAAERPRGVIYVDAEGQPTDDPARRCGRGSRVRRSRPPRQPHAVLPRSQGAALAAGQRAASCSGSSPCLPVWLAMALPPDVADAHPADGGALWESLARVPPQPRRPEPDGQEREVAVTEKHAELNHQAGVAGFVVVDFRPAWPRRKPSRMVFAQLLAAAVALSAALQPVGHSGPVSSRRRYGSQSLVQCLAAAPPRRLARGSSRSVSSSAPRSSATKLRDAARPHRAVRTDATVGEVCPDGARRSSDGHEGGDEEGLSDRGQPGETWNGNPGKCRRPQ